MLPYAVGGLVFLTWFGPEPIRTAITRVLSTFVFICLVISYFVVGFVRQEVHSGLCSLGVQSSCYVYSYDTSARIHGLTLVQQQELLRRIDKNLPTGLARNLNSSYRWYIMRDEWYDGEAVQTSHACVARYNQSPIMGDCFDRVILTGKNKGKELPNRGELIKDSAYDYMLKQWNRTPNPKLNF